MTGEDEFAAGYAATCKPLLGYALRHPRGRRRPRTAELGLKFG